MDDSRLVLLLFISDTSSFLFFFFFFKWKGKGQMESCGDSLLEKKKKKKVSNFRCRKHAFEKIVK